MAEQTTFEVLESPHFVGKKEYPKGSRITTTDPLDKMFPGKFRKVGASLLAAAKRAKDAPPADEPPKAVSVPKPAAAQAETDDEEVENEETTTTDAGDADEEGTNAVSADDVDVSQEFPQAVTKKVMVKLTPDKTYKVVDPESEELIEEGMSKADLKKFLKTYKAGK